MASRSLKQHVTAWIAAIVLAFLSVIPAPTAMAAQDLFTQACSGAADSAVCKSKAEGTNRQDAATKVGNVINIILLILGIMAVIMIIYGGFRYVLSNGDEAGVKSGRNTILYAVIGLIVAIMSYGIVSFVISRLQSQ